tara:strand:+ start:560 stop:814 length:255 start_codon:yes stop_codon:yes gene_type:complete
MFEKQKIIKNSFEAFAPAKTVAQEEKEVAPDLDSVFDRIKNTPDESFTVENFSSSDFNAICIRLNKLGLRNKIKLAGTTFSYIK